MEEGARKQRNTDRMRELYPTFRSRIRRVIRELEVAGFRPRIQQAWRSPEEQRPAFESGQSKLLFGFHNVTGPRGPEALAVDLLDDDNPLSPRREYLLRLAAAAGKRRLATGIR